MWNCGSTRRARCRAGNIRCFWRGGNNEKRILTVRPTIDVKGPPAGISYKSVLAGASIPNRPPTNGRTSQVQHEITREITREHVSSSTTTTTTTTSQVAHQVHYILDERDHQGRRNLPVGFAPCNSTAVPVTMTVLGRIERRLLKLT